MSLRIFKIRFKSSMCGLIKEFLLGSYVPIIFQSSFVAYNFLSFQITILVAAEGVHKLPSINGGGDLKEALQKLGSIPSSKILVRT